MAAGKVVKRKGGGVKLYVSMALIDGGEKGTKEVE